MQNVSYFFCDDCKKETHFVHIGTAIKITGVSRSTIYYWIDHEWVHWRELPSGRRVICQESLSRSGKHAQVITRVSRAKGAAA
jgi:predicted site-specific integrase-resolvase